MADFNSTYYEVLKELNLTLNSSFDFNAAFGNHKDSKFEIVLKYLFYLLSMSIAVVGNTCIITVILRTKSLRTKFNIYIVNLSFSHLLVPLFCMWIHLINSMNADWIFGEFFCKIHTFIQVSVVCSCVFTLLVVTLDRFLATVVPSATWLTQNCQFIIIAFIWIAAFSISLPWLLYQLYAEFDWVGGHDIVCQSKFPTPSAMRTYYTSFFIIVYVIPLVIMFTLLVVTVIKGDNSRGRNESGSVISHQEMRSRAVYMLLTTLVVFCLCWTPQQSLLIWDVYRDRTLLPTGLKELHYVSLYMAYSSSAINPVVYFLYNKCFRHALYHLCQHRCKGDNTSPAVGPDPETSVSAHADELDMNRRQSAMTSETHIDATSINSDSLTTVELDD